MNEEPTQREPIQITTAWASYGDDAPWLIAAYDEFTAEEHNGEPDFYTEAISRSSDFMVREIILTVDFDAICKAFDTPVVEAAALSGGKDRS